MCIANAAYIIHGYSDPFNKTKRRNRNNTKSYEYNCGGYALGTYSWYCPCVDRKEISNISYIYRTKQQEEKLLRHCIEVMLSEIEGLRVIKDLSEVQADEYAIAFKLGKTWNDFHYIRRGKNGVWYEKCGSEQKINIVPTRKALAKDWDMYHGRTVFFAKKF